MSVIKIELRHIWCQKFLEQIIYSTNKINKKNICILWMFALVIKHFKKFKSFVKNNLMCCLCQPMFKHTEFAGVNKLNLMAKK